jgi:hypothetical protein
VQTPLAAGIGAALWSAGLGLAFTTALVLGSWAIGGRDTSGARGALIAGAQGWLLALGTDLRLEHGSLTLIPLGLTLVLGALLMRSGIWAGRAAMVQTLREAATATLTLTVVYVSVAVGVSIAATSPGVTPAPVTALIGSAAIAVVAGGYGVLHGSGLVGTALDRLPPEGRLALRGGLGGAAALLAGGAVVLAASLIWHAQDAAHLYSALGTDLVGSIQLLGLCIAYVPVAVIWAMTYCLGPGFAVGSGTLVAPSGTSLGDLPAFPLLAALPGEGPTPGTAMAGLAVPVLAGLVLGVLVARRSVWTAGRTAGIGAAAGAVTGVLAGLLSVLAAGGLTGGRMSALGPEPLLVAAWSALELSALGALAAGEYRRRSLGRSARRTADGPPAKAKAPASEASTADR